MESSKEPVSVRIARINAEITGKTKNPHKTPLLGRESLLDALQLLYDECCSENLQKYDSNIAEFVKKYKSAMKEIISLRVNISDFEIKNIIGCGHFGEVHVVKEKQTGDVYAMKTIRKFDNETKRISFEEERDIMAFSNSPWLTSVQYAFQDSSYLFFVMDYHPGGDLLGLLYRKGGTLPESAALFYIAELFLALEDLHYIGYVHRDVKPDNILLDRCGHLKLADFGSAAKLNKNGLVKMGPPVGTPDYIAPEVLQCLDNKSEKCGGYGVSCDFWSLGVLAYELVIGNPPFQGQNTTALYSKIINHQKNLKFPADVVLSQAYVSFVKSLITDCKTRLKPDQIKSHVLFKSMNFDTLRDQVPPYVPKITSVEDTSNFTDVQAKKRNPSIENFKKKMQFSGRNLPFVGFTFTHDPNGMFEPSFQRRSLQKNELVETMKAELETLRMKVSKSGDANQEKENLEKKLEEKSRKLESIEVLRDKLEKDLAGSIAECAALKRTLDLERKDRVDLEKKALDLIKGAKLKWELAEKSKIEVLNLEIEQHKEKIEELTNTNKMLDERLHHALNMEEKNRQSIENVQNLSRRSVIGLENRLEKVTTETQSTISELQSKVNEEIHQKSLLRNKIATLKDRELDLKEKLRISKANYEGLSSKVFEAETVIKGLSSKVSDLEKDVEKIEDYKAEIKILQNLFDNSKKTINDLQNSNLLLQNECKVLDEYKKEMVEMKEKILTLQNDNRVRVFEKELEKEREHCQALKKRLEEAENSATKSQELREKQMQFWKIEKELSNCKIDKRILERELKEAQVEIKQLHEKLANSEKDVVEKRKAQEAALLEMSYINENISMELVKVQESNKSLQEQLQNEKAKLDSEKSVINELKGIISTKEDRIKNLEREIHTVRNESVLLAGRCKKEEADKSRILILVEEQQKEKAQLHDEIDRIKQKMINTNLNRDALREACTLLETQVIEYENIVSASKAKESELNANTEKLISDLCQARQETQEAKRHINEQKSLRAVAEQTIKRLKEDIECLEKECADYKKQCIDYKQFSSGLSEELTSAEERLSNAEVKIKSYERQIEKFSSENHLLKEEISENITKISNLRESNYKSNHQIKDFKESNAGLIHKIRELERILHEKSNYYKEREMKADATIKQQIKLIDYLQTKIDEYTHKKKTLTEVIFGSSKKENHPPVSLAMNYKDLETELTKERQNNRQLKEEVYKLKAATLHEINSNVMDKFGKMEKSKSEILTPKSKEALNQIVNPPGSQKKDVYRQNSVERMHHNIPHRFESKIATNNQRCAQCHNQILLGRNHHVCKECKTVAHVVCSSGLPKVCGLPKEFVERYMESMEKATSPKGEKTGGKVEKKDMQDAVCEGWIKIPCNKSNSWEKRYARLTHFSLDIYAQPPKDAGTIPVESFTLKPDGSHGKVILEPLQSEIGIPVATSDLPFVMKVEVTPETTCWPSKCFIIMALSAKEKDNWFSALQRYFDADQINSKLKTVVELPASTVVNCIVELTENIKVLGTDRGLYSYYDNNLLYMEGATNVEQIGIFAPPNLVLMIAGPKSTLISCDINHLINLIQCAGCTKPMLKYRDISVNSLNGFHILQISRRPTQKKIAVATTKQLIILEYDYDTNEFIPIRILDTAQPISCMLFTENSLIVGADKFFEIDLISFMAEEFLDASDDKLKQALKCYKMGSFPISILEISSNPKEYLLSFNEFSIFVDEYGCSSRQKEIKNDHLPLALHLAKNYLYVIQFAAVEILKITEETCNSNTLDQYRLELSKFKYLGSNCKGIFIEQDSEAKFLSARNLPDFDAVSIISESTETGAEIGNESNDSRFSFTSSIVQSLDGNLSDSTSSDHIDTVRRKVKFDQSDF